jgi:streptogrisin C
MHVYPLYRLNRSGAALIVTAAVVIMALVAPVHLAWTGGVTTPAASAAAVGAASLADPAALSIAAQQHVTLAEAETRLAWQQAVPSLNAALSSQLSAATLGGIWIATNDGDRVKVGVVGLNPRIRAVVLRAVRATGLFGAADLVPVKYSLSQLVSADTWVAGQLDRLSPRAGGIDLDVGYRPDLNRVQLGVAGHQLTAAERALVARATARYGDLIQVIAVPPGSMAGTSLDCANVYCFPPLRGGINIFRLNSQGHPAPGQCTSGFVARGRVTGNLYLLTAGHCAVEDGTGTWGTYFPGGSVHAIGTVHHYLFGASGDEAILNINNPSGWRLPQGWVYVTAGPNTTRNERYPISSAQYSTQGARICETGAATGHSICGIVVRLGVTSCYGGLPCRVVNNLGEASFCGNPGDSGAPVFAAHQAFGLVTTGAADLVNGYSCVTYYQGINGAANAMNVNIVTAH